jgi:hypothetical protein
MTDKMGSQNRRSLEKTCSPVAGVSAVVVEAENGSSVRHLGVEDREEH